MKKSGRSLREQSSEENLVAIRARRECGKRVTIRRVARRVRLERRLRAITEQRVLIVARLCNTRASRVTRSSACYLSISRASEIFQTGPPRESSTGSRFENRRKAEGGSVLLCSPASIGPVSFSPARRIVVETRTHLSPPAYGIDPENRTSAGECFRHDAYSRVVGRVDETH